MYSPSRGGRFSTHCDAVTAAAAVLWGVWENAANPLTSNTARVGLEDAELDMIDTQWLNSHNRIMPQLCHIVVQNEHAFRVTYL